jgi:fatty acid-binding protein DegV
VLNKKILSLNLISNHKGKQLVRMYKHAWKNGGLKKVCVIVDNSSANYVALTYLIREMSDIRKNNNNKKNIKKKLIKVSESNQID